MQDLYKELNIKLTPGQISTLVQTLNDDFYGINKIVDMEDAFGKLKDISHEQKSYIYEMIRNKRYIKLAEYLINNLNFNKLN